MSKLREDAIRKEERAAICRWLEEYANTAKWRAVADSDEIRHFVSHAIDYIEMGEYLVGTK